MRREDSARDKVSIWRPPPPSTYSCDRLKMTMVAWIWRPLNFHDKRDRPFRPPPPSFARWCTEQTYAVLKWEIQCSNSIRFCSAIYKRWVRKLYIFFSHLEIFKSYDNFSNQFDCVKQFIRRNAENSNYHNLNSNELELLC